MSFHVRKGYGLFTIVYVIALFWFFLRYVPLISSFLTLLIPTLFCVLVLTSLDPQKGTLFFVFAFPLINNLPYLFGILEDMPHAPTALVLFLFYFLGWLTHKSFSGSRPGILRKYPVFAPLCLFSAVIVISSLITFLRYANFFPFLSDYIYELITNVRGVTAGGAIMSTVFFSLNYLTGFAFFFILLDTIKSEKFIKKMAWIFTLGVLFSLVFSLYQHLADLGSGNTLRGIREGLINGTFTDSLSLGTFIAIVFPLLMGWLLYLRGGTRSVPFLVLSLSLYIIFFTGSKSGLFCLVLSIIIFCALSFKFLYGSKKSGTFVLNRSILIPLGVVILVGLLIFFLIMTRSDSTEVTTISRFNKLLEKDLPRYFSTQRAHLWHVAGLMIKDYPFTGTGIGGYIIESSNYAEIHGISLWNPQSAENYILQIGAELGLVGIFLILWVFWEIAKKIKHGLQNISDMDRSKFIFFGAISGIISFFVNIQVHSFIGSYEIKYTFWLLVALVFYLSDRQEKQAEIFKLGKNPSLFFMILIILFGIVHTWNSTHSLSIENRTERLGLTQEFGFYPPERTIDGKYFRWTRGYGGLPVTITMPVMRVPLLASHPDIMVNPVEVKIFLVKDLFKGKKLLEEIMLNRSEWKDYEFQLPNETYHDATLLFKVSRTWNPSKMTGAPDSRNLGIAVGEIQFVENKK